MAAFGALCAAFWLRQVWMLFPCLDWRGSPQLMRSQPQSRRYGKRSIGAAPAALLVAALAAAGLLGGGVTSHPPLHALAQAGDQLAQAESEEANGDKADTGKANGEDKKRADREEEEDGAEAEEQTAQPQQPVKAFALPAQRAEVSEALEDFKRYRERRTWERAFKALEQLADPANTGLLQRPDGFYVPPSAMMRYLLADLPPEGKDAYRLFHDATARALLAEAEGYPPGSPEEAERLTRLLDRYFVTAPAAAAADRLGDAAFEQGDLERAAELWQQVLTHHPDSQLARVRLLVKAATALARLGRWSEFDEVQRQVRQQHAGESVRVAGQDVPALDYLDRLAAQRTDQADPQGPRAPYDLTLPEAAEPVWQFRFLTQADAQALTNMGANWGWGMRFPVVEMVPPVVVDERRVYINLLGYHLALDRATGKLLWRSQRFHDLVQKLQQSQMHQPEQYQLVDGGDRLWSVYRDVNVLGQPGQPFRLSCWEKASGKEIWHSQAVAELANWSLMGRPLVLGDRIVTTGVKTEQPTELHALALRADDGRLLWTTHLGTYQADPSQAWYQRGSHPYVLAHHRRVYVETGAGAVIELDPGTGRIHWALSYESEVPNTSSWWGWWGGPSSGQTLVTSAPPIVWGGRLYFKGMRSQRLYAIDLGQPRVLWKRPVNKSSMLVGMDEQCLYLGGEDLTAIDVATQRLVWAARLPRGTSWVQPLLTANRLYQFTSRGIFELDKRTGDKVRLFRGGDLDSLGGAMYVQGGLLLTVSNLAITAYRLDATGAADLPQAAALPQGHSPADSPPGLPAVPAPQQQR
jgi:outer membrane protein assembly factor BamB